MNELPIINTIYEYTSSNPISFCMPGHKHGNGFLNTKEGRRFHNNVLAGDITEIQGMDNLHAPEGIIKDSAILLGKLYNSHKSYLLVNGSTSGNLSMIFSAFSEYDKVIVERNCHKSIFNGILLRKLKPVYIQNTIQKDYLESLTLSTSDIENTIKSNPDAKGIILTYPNYFGVCMDLKYICKIAHEHGMKVLVDCAHGAHFVAHPELPDNPIDLGADMVVMSAHKTLPAFTQTAFLHINESMDVNTVDFYVSIFLSTSPSYLLMQSMDYSIFYLSKYGKKDYEKLIDLCSSYSSLINDLNGFSVLSKNDIPNESSFSSIDPTRIVIKSDIMNGHELNDYLLDKGIQVEMSTEKTIVLIPTPFNFENDFNALYSTLKALSCKRVATKSINDDALTSLSELPRVSLLPYEVLNHKSSWINIDDAEGKVSKESIIPYPPGVPIIMPGEIINKEIIAMIKKHQDFNVDILGIKDNLISIIDV